MNGSRDFIEWLGQDVTLKILMCLEEPSDLVRTSAVSSSWRHFVIANALCKELCLKMFPKASSFARVIEIRNKVELEAVTNETDGSAEKWACLEREHRVYASLSRVLTTSTIENCISGAICASSTDNYPEESIKNTLERSDRVDHRASYWSSKGASDPSAPETLIYKMVSNLCLITEFHVHPFQAYFQFGLPIYSAKTVKFQIGHPKVRPELESGKRDESLNFQNFVDDKFVWTYTSPEFPMVQDNCLQKFKLPEPVLGIGGILRVELLGRAQTQVMDGLYYICINHVQVLGGPLSPAFDIEMIDEQGECTLKYNPGSMCKLLTSEGLKAEPHRFIESIRTWEQMILNTFLGVGPLVIDEYDSDYEHP